MPSWCSKQGPCSSVAGITKESLWSTAPFLRAERWHCKIHSKPPANSPLAARIEDRLRNLNTYPMVLDSNPLVIILSGPSGVGKDAVLKHLRQSRPKMAIVVTATSRAMRPGEVDGQDYFFLSKDEFEAWIQDGRFVEHALVYGEYKGIPKSQIDNALAEGVDVILRLDVQGAQTIQQLIPEAISIFLVAESEVKLVERLIARKTEPLECMLKRIETASRECCHLRHFDYVVTNRQGRLSETAEAICAIIDAEKLRVPRRIQDIAL